MEFQCGTCRYDTQAQSSVQGFIVGAAHFGARVLKMRPTGEGGTPKRLKIRLFQGAMKWTEIFLKQSQPQAHHVHRVSLPGSSVDFCKNIKILLKLLFS